ncbi:MAG TPA: hypothetical protein VH969_17155 [Actinophytocola sp.]|uniref:hypothetical protein n=1 Tax=Actinophytocola sp. TaxID=1872138 RepID=UPI002F944C74
MSRAAAVDVPRLGRGVPAWTLRAAVLVAGALVIAIPSTEGAMWGGLFILTPTILASVYAPASPAPIAVVIGAGVLVALTGDDPLRPTVLAMIPTVHLFHVCCGLAGLIPVRGRVHPRAFARPALRFVVVQAIVFAFVGVAALQPVTRIPAGIEITALAGLLVIALIVLLWHRQSKRQADE